MLSISPTRLNVTTAPPVSATSIFALPGWRNDVTAEAESLGTKGVLRSDDIPFDDGPAVCIPHVAPKPKFEHVPQITYRRGDEIIVVTGPIEPTVPRIIPETDLGWQKWFGDAAAAAAAAKKAGAERTAATKAYFNGRRVDKEAEFEAKCKRALAKGKPLPKRSQPSRSAAGLDAVRQGSGVNRQRSGF